MPTNRVTRTAAIAIASEEPPVVVESAHAAAFKNLLPRGAAWWAATRPELLSEMDKLIDGLTAEADRVARRSLDMLREMDPRTTQELLPDWERNWGLPDLCAEPPTTIADRQAALTSRVVTRGDGVTVPLLLQIAIDFGYPDVILRRFHLAPFLCTSECDQPLYTPDQGWPFRWEFILPGDVADPNVICQIERSAWAHLQSEFASPAEGLQFAFPAFLFTDADVTFVRGSTAIFVDPTDLQQTNLAANELGTAFFGG